MSPRTIVAVLDSIHVVNDPAIDWAVSLARWHDASLHVVHVRRSRRRATDADRARRSALADGIGRIVDAVDGGGLAVVPAVLSGPPVSAVAEYSRRVDADLVVVTDRPKRSRGYWLRGAFAAALGKAVEAPTLVVRAAPQAIGPSGPFRNIVAAVDFTEASLRGVSAALDLAQRSGGRLRLVHILSGFPYESAYGGAAAPRLGLRLGGDMARLKRQLWRLIPPDASSWADIEASTVAGEARAGILRAAADARADLIVLGLPRRSRLEEVLAGTTVHGVLRRAPSPVLLVPGPDTPARASAEEARAVMLVP